MDRTLHQTIESDVGVPFFVAMRPAEDAGGESDYGLYEMYMAGRKEFRNLTVGELYGNGKTVPMIRLSGQWLEELGFTSGDYVSVKREDGKMIISLDTEKSDEQAFIEEETQKLLKMFKKEKSKLHARYVAERKAGYGA
jgi:hypothetical protein